MKPLVVFDFDGPIVSNKESTYNAFNKALPEFGYSKISPKEAAELRNKRIQEIIRQKRISYIKLYFLLKRLTKYLRDETKKNHITPEIKKMLNKLNEEGYEMCIVTSNSRKNVNLILKKAKIKYIKNIYAEVSLFGKSKILKKVAKINNRKNDEVLYIGDEIRDVEAANKAKVKSVAITWGINTEKALSKEKPTHIIRKPSSLYKTLKRESSS